MTKADNRDQPQLGMLMDRIDPIDCFGWLDGPVRRIAAMDVWVAYSPELEDRILPQTPDVLRGIVELAGY